MNQISAFYNGVLLQDCELLTWNTDCFHDQKPDAKKRLVARHVIAVKSDRVSLVPELSMMPSVALAGIVDDIGSAWTGESLERLDELLRGPRQDFWFHSDEFWEAPCIASTGVPDGEITAICPKIVMIDRSQVLDADNGPKPSGLIISRSESGSVCVQLTVEACRFIN